jgi:hypothetical protein
MLWIFILYDNVYGQSNNDELFYPKVIGLNINRLDIQIKLGPVALVILPIYKVLIFF